MNLNNIRLNIDEKTIEKNKKRKKQIKNRFFHKKPFFIEIKNQKIKNGFLPNTRLETNQYSIRKEINSSWLFCR